MRRAVVLFLFPFALMLAAPPAFAMPAQTPPTTSVTGHQGGPDNPPPGAGATGGGAPAGGKATSGGAPPDQGATGGSGSANTSNAKSNTWSSSGLLIGIIVAGGA